jgi:hypothetical protein
VLTVAKTDNLDPTYLEWLINSRMKNQIACLKLFNAFEQFPEQAKSKEFRDHSYNLVAVGFSLWRAAFLADKTGARESVFEDARAFLAQLLTNNAINYPQDRQTREWTFNYYMINATNYLRKLAKKWPTILDGLLIEKSETVGTSISCHRWDSHHNAFESALSSYCEALANFEGKPKKLKRLKRIVPEKSS